MHPSFLWMCTAHCTQGATCNFMCLSVCAEFGFLLSSFASYSLTHSLTYCQRFKKKNVEKCQSGILLNLRMQFLHFLSYFSLWKLFDTGWSVPQLSNQAQIQMSQFPKNQNRPKFWMLSVIRMHFSRRKFKRFLQFHTQASQSSISDFGSYSYALT